MVLFATLGTTWDWRKNHFWRAKLHNWRGWSTEKDAASAVGSGVDGLLVMGIVGFSLVLQGATYTVGGDGGGRGGPSFRQRRSLAGGEAEDEESL